jgi:hypothetical protein
MNIKETILEILKNIDKQKLYAPFIRDDVEGILIAVQYKADVPFHYHVHNEIDLSKLAKDLFQVSKPSGLRKSDEIYKNLLMGECFDETEFEI